MLNISNNSRSVVNILGVPIMLYGIYSHSAFPLMVLVILFFCSIEYSKLTSLISGNINKYLFLALNITIFLNSIFNFIDMANLMILIFLFIFVYEMLISRESNVINISYYLMGFFWIGICLCSSLIYLRGTENGMFLTYLLFVSTWICDTFAFIFGSKFGNNKILPSISPKKTWVGCFSGFVGVVIIMAYLYLSGNSYGFSDMNFIFFALILGVVGQLGDFGESFIKRQADVKDTSNILMGHGGFLDRFDSISFAAPSFYLYILYFIL
tara:strand:+ start:3087 stop:3890 length:804 start_codon:yes stop_codon:yes gene_type:complete